MTAALTVSLPDAAHGATQRVRLPNGKDVEVKIPAGIASGQQIRLRGQGAAVAAVAVGGALGAAARWALATLFPAPPGGFPLTTFVVNVVGCLLMGVLVVLVAEAREAHPIIRPFLAVGVLGGFTTFSSYVVEARQLLDRGHLGVGLLYLVDVMPGRRLRPYWGRLVDILESFTAVALLPLLLQVLHVYGLMRGLAG